MENLINSNKLFSLFGVSGHEEEVANFIKEELKDISFEILNDKLGNIIVKAGEGKEKLMLCAHMDTIGVIATFIEENGFVRVGALGDYELENFKHNLVVFKNGLTGRLSGKKDNFFLDLGFKSREEVIEHIKEGDTAVFKSPNVELNHFIMGANLDDRIGCFILLQLIKETKDFNKEVYFVFSTQNKLGFRGARAAAYSIKPDYCIVVDLEESSDYIGGDSIFKLGEGPILKVMDKNLILHHQVRELLEEEAKKLKIQLQYGVSNTFSDGGAIHKEGIGIKTGVLGIPCRYNQTLNEMVSLTDIEETIKLLKSVISKG